MDKSPTENDENARFINGWPWDPPKRGEKMPEPILYELEGVLYGAYEFHTVSKKRKPKATVMRYMRELLERIHLDKNMEELCWAISEAVLDFENPYAPPQFRMWQHDAFVLEALVMMLEKRMNQQGLLYYKRSDSQELHRIIWEGDGTQLLLAIEQWNSNLLKP